jgi:hypothetical protein
LKNSDGHRPAATALPFQHFSFQRLNIYHPMPYLILAQSEVTARALGAWLELLGEPGVEKPKADERCILVGQLIRTEDRGVTSFEIVVDRIAKAMAEAAPLPVTVLADAVKPASLNPLSQGGDWDSLLAMWILALPEVRWVFGVGSNQPVPTDALTEANWDWHNLTALLGKPWRNPLMDPTGLRNHVKKLAEKKKAHGIPNRKERAAAIDEEVHYALFHAYTAYRFGYRADSVVSWQLMTNLFGDKVPTNEKHSFHLLLEDVNLYFPDRPEATHLSRFEENRAKNCWRLGYGNDKRTGDGVPIESSEFRIIVSSGHSGSSPRTMEENEAFVKRNKPKGWGFVLKPTGGMFDLWAKARLFERLRPQSRGGIGGSRAGLAPEFHWPPKVETAGNGSGSHSAPGKLMLVASHLIRRADALRSDANTVEECIRGAVLATDAVELLGYRTPTLALQALELKQWFETKAEVAFVGVGHHFQLERRFKEIEQETRVAAQFHHRGRRDAAALDAAVTIANRLTLIFREAGQFDEEEECLRKLRWWNRKLSFRRARNKYYLWPGLGLLAYAEWLISSLGWLMLSVAGWMLMIGLVWWAWTPGNDWMNAVKGAVDSFISSNVETTTQDPFMVFLSTFSALVGFFHLGVFVSFLYSAIARK